MRVPADISSRIDVCRLLGVTLILVIHTPSPHTLGHHFDQPANEFFWMFTQAACRSAGTATLSAISGYLILRTTRSATFLSTIRKKLRSLIMPALLWSILFTVLAFAFQVIGLKQAGNFQLFPPQTLDVLDAIVGFDKGPLNYPIFFLFDLMVCILLFPVFRVLCARAPWISLLALLAASVSNYELIPGLRPDIPLAFFTGCLIAYREVDLSRLDDLRWLWIGGFVGGCLLYAGFGMTYGFDDPQLRLRMLNLLRLLGPLVVWSIAGLLVGTRAGHRLQILAPAAFFIFCSHWNYMQYSAQLYYRWAAPHLDATFWFFIVFNTLIAICAGLVCIQILQITAPGLLRILSGGRLGAPSVRWRWGPKRAAAQPWQAERASSSPAHSASPLGVDRRAEAATARSEVSTRR